MGSATTPAEGAPRTRSDESPMPHNHGPAAPADTAVPRRLPAPFSLLRQGLGPRLALATLPALAVWGLIGWATA